MTAIIGIDLGTSNSVVAWENDLEQVGVVTAPNGAHVHPSMVAFTDEGSVVGSVVVGAAAKACRIEDPRNTIYSFKRLMGQTATSVAVRQMRSRVSYEIVEGPDQMPVVETRAGRFTSVELSAIMLDHLRELAAAHAQREISHAVITVPANFNDAQRSATASAGAIAGLEVVRVLNEPTAAALAYGATRRLNEIIAVYDFGGGTFDLTVMKLENQVYTVLGTAGDSFLGGDDIDERIVERMIAKVVKDHRVDLREDVFAMMRLRTIAEQVKIELSARPRVGITIRDLVTDKKGRPVPFQFELAHGELIDMISDLTERTMSVTRDALAVAQVTRDRVSDVILVGGTTRIPYIRKQVTAFFEKAVRTDVSPDDAVAIGAALQAGSLERLLIQNPGSSSINVPFDNREPLAVPRTSTSPYEDHLREPAAPVGAGMDSVDVELELDSALSEMEPAVPLVSPSSPIIDLDLEMAPAGTIPPPIRTEGPPALLPIAPAAPIPVPHAPLVPVTQVAPEMPIARPVVIDVTPTSLGVGTLGGFCETLIWRSSPLPITVKKRYTTVRDHQESVRIVVCQGETRRLSDNVVLGDVVLAELPQVPRGQVEIEVSFELDTSGMLQVSARDAATGRQQLVALDLVGRLDEEEVAAARDRMLKLRG